MRKRSPPRRCHHDGNFCSGHGGGCDSDDGGCDGGGGDNAVGMCRLY